jgi:AcrR family transcriptional regulator
MTDPVSLSTREIILDAAEHLFARYGYRKTTVDDLARESGIAKGTVYLYFKNKEEIALGRIGRVLATLRARLEAIAASSDPPLQKLRGVLIDRIMFRVDSAQVYATDIETLLGEIRPALATERQRFLRVEIQVVTSVLRRAGVANAGKVAAALIDATNAFLPSSLTADAVRRPQSVRRRLSLVVDLLMSGLKPLTNRRRRLSVLGS